MDDVQVVEVAEVPMTMTMTTTTSTRWVVFAVLFYLSRVCCSLFWGRVRCATLLSLWVVLAVLSSFFFDR